MNIPGLDTLTVLKDYRRLKSGNKVFSKIYGVGEVIRLNGADEIVVHFPCGVKRFSVIEEDISLIPKKQLVKQPAKLSITHNGEKVSLRAFKTNMKKERELEKRRKLFEQELESTPAVRVKWNTDPVE